MAKTIHHPSRQDQLANLPEDYLLCRIAHPWEIKVGYGVKHKGSEWPQWRWIRLHCPRCGTTGERDYDHLSSRVTGTYRYPRGYQIRGAGRGHGPAEALNELLRRQGPPPRARRRRAPRNAAPSAPPLKVIS
jgi:hypothetical protein